jgi:transketolase subunit B
METNKLNTKILSSLGQGGSIFGITLLDLMKEREDIVVLSADMSTPAGLDKFKSLYANHFFNLGIAEQNMIGVAAGLMDEGYKTISVAQACFISMRCFEPVRQFLGYMHSKQVLVGIGSGFSLTFMGNTHYALEDIALMRSIPGMTVIAPSDALQAMKALEAAMRKDGPVYIRLHGGAALPIVYEEDFDFEIGKAISLRTGKDIQLIATGSMVSIALQVADQLAGEGISVSVFDMHTIKPLDTTILDMGVPVIISLEEHRVIGGLGDSIADYLSRYESHPRLLKIGVKDEFSVVGDYSYLMEQNGLSRDKIVERVKSFL